MLSLKVKLIACIHCALVYAEASLQNRKSQADDVDPGTKQVSKAVQPLTYSAIYGLLHDLTCTCCFHHACIILSDPPCAQTNMCNFEGKVSHQSV